MSFSDNDIVFCSVCISMKSPKKPYSEWGKQFILSVLQNTPHKVSLLTNVVDYFSEFKNNDRVILIDSEDKRIRAEHKDSWVKTFFWMHLKRHAIKHCANNFANAKYIIYADCDSFPNESWDSKKFYKFLSKCDFDIAYHHIAHLNYGNWKKEIEPLSSQIPKSNLSLKSVPQETNLIIKNNEKLKLFLDFWGKIEKRTGSSKRTHRIGAPIGYSVLFAQMKVQIMPNHDNKIWNNYYTKFWTLHNLGYDCNFYGKSILKSGTTPPWKRK